MKSKNKPTQKAFVSGCFDLLHSGHVRFFEQAAEYGDLYVAIGSDRTVKELKGRPPVNPEAERKYMVESVKHVKECFISSGSGIMDFIAELERISPDIFIVNEDGHSSAKEALCEKKGIRYVVLKRAPKKGLPIRSTTKLRAKKL